MWNRSRWARWGCTHDSLDAIGCRRLECLLAATCLQTFNEHVKIAGCLGGSVVSKPNEQRIGVGDGRFAKAEAGANLSTESFCSTRGQQLTEAVTKLGFGKIYEKSGCPNSPLTRMSAGCVPQTRSDFVRERVLKFRPEFRNSLHHHLPGPARRVARPAHQSLAAQTTDSNRGQRLYVRSQTAGDAPSRGGTQIESRRLLSTLRTVLRDNLSSRAIWRIDFLSRADNRIFLIVSTVNILLVRPPWQLGHIAAAEHG